MDIDGDGRTDIISGSWPGEIYFFQRLADGSFAAGTPLKDRSGTAINVGHASSPFFTDWDRDGDLDLLVGAVAGDVYLVPQENVAGAKGFSKGQPLKVDDQPIKIEARDAAPVAADWDSDGLKDLIVGAEDGSVVWFRNIGKPSEPKLAAAQPLIPKSPVGWKDDAVVREGDWGLRAKICVTDWNGDGRLDILLGDRCGGFQGKPAQTDDERTQERDIHEKLPELMQKWATAFREYRSLQDSKEGGDKASSQRLTDLREKLKRLKEEIAVAQEIQSHYRPQQQAHGFVWLFLRKAKGEEKPQAKGSSQ